MTRRRSLHAELTRAREALARAREAGADPWRLAELQLRHDELLERALDLADEAELAPALAAVPAARTPAAPYPLAWTDESGRSRRGPKNGGAS